MKTKDLSEIQLHKYFDEHVRYEVQMLLNATGAILKQTPISQELQYMPIESYAIHLRNIITFLYPFSRRDTDVCANDFFIDKSSWLEVRPKISEILKTAKDRADKEVGHLTTSRLSGTPEKKKWNVKELTDELMPLLKLFCESSDKVKLTQSIEPLLKQYVRIKD